MSLQAIISEFIADAPPGELAEVASDIKAIVSKPTKHDLTVALEESNAAHGNVVLLKGKATLISRHTQTSTKKYVDFNTATQFNVDVNTNEAVDVEAYDSEYHTSEYTLLCAQLSSYVMQHYPTEATFAVVPPGFSGEAYTLIINGWKHNPANYYNGAWRSVYLFDGETLRSAGVDLDVHYYEDGNVRLKCHLEPAPVAADLAIVVAGIGRMENAVELEIATKVNELNETVFKNLRRLLPVSRAKIQWGKAMGNYKLGKDVVNE